MLLSYSCKGRLLAQYRTLYEPYEIIEVDFIEKDLQDDDKYEFIGTRVEKSIDDAWEEKDGYTSQALNVLLECEYCGAHFVTSLRKRLDAISAFRVVNAKHGLEMVRGELDIYKDNCEDCHYEKAKESTLLRHGFENPFMTKESRTKRAKTFARHGNVPSSRAQRYIAKLMGAEINSRIDWFFADMIIDDKVVIEYDGGGHNLSVLMGQVSQESFDKQEKARTQHMVDKGYKMLRVISPADMLPKDESYLRSLLCEAVADLYLAKESESHITFSTKTMDSTHGELRHIKQILEDSEWGEELL